MVRTARHCWLLVPPMLALLLMACGEGPAPLLDPPRYECVEGLTRDHDGDVTTPCRLVGRAAVSAGMRLSCGVSLEGIVDCRGRLGDSEGSAPAWLGRDAPIVDVATGDAAAPHACALDDAGRVTCWGDDGAGQARVPDGLDDVVQVSAGNAHTCARRGDGGVVCWGDVTHLQGFVPPGVDFERAVDVSAGGDRTCVVDGAGELHCWGATFDSIALPSVPTSPSLALPAGLGHVIQVSVGRGHICAVDREGLVRCGGDNDFGQGQPLAGLGPITEVAVGGQHSCALLADRTVACWGDDSLGQARVPPDLEGVLAISAGAYHTCATDGVATTCWGDDSFGQVTGRTVPDVVLGPAARVATGAGQVCALDGAGTLDCWLFCEDPTGLAFPEAPTVSATVPLELEGQRVVDVSSASGWNCAVTEVGAVFCWGEHDDAGQLRVPEGLGEVVAVGTGGSRDSARSCALDLAGRLTCWGRQAPLPDDLGTVVDFAVGGGHVCVLSDRTDPPELRCVDASGRELAVPSDLGMVVALTAGEQHACAISHDGSVRCFLNTGGSMADAVPMDLSPVNRISAGAAHTCAITSGGEVRCWGGGYGEGLPESPFRTPAPEVLGEAWEIASGDDGSACIIDAAGEVLCWAGLPGCDGLM